MFDDAATMHIALAYDGRSIGRTSMFRELAESIDARDALVDVLRAAPFTAYFWETAPTRDDDRPFECVLVDAPSLRATRANPHAFAERLKSPDEAIATFTNLGGDAELVVPKPVDAWDGAHLGAFVRSAPDALVDALFRSVAITVVRRLDADRRPLWVSTSGLGVPWLHVRLDSMPKYYAHGPYRDAQA